MDHERHVRRGSLWLVNRLRLRLFQILDLLLVGRVITLDLVSDNVLLFDLPLSHWSLG